MKYLILLPLAIAIHAQSQPPASLTPTLGQSVLLSWTAPNPPVDSYNVYSTNTTCPLTPITGTPMSVGNATTAILTTLIPGTYCWAVTAVVGGVESPQSNFASITILPGKYDDLQAGSGIQIARGSPTTIGLDYTTQAMVTVGPTVPATCATTNSVFFNTYTNSAGQITIVSIWLCGPNHKWQKPLLYKQT